MSAAEHDTTQFNMSFKIRVPDEIVELSDEKLISEQEALAEHEEGGVLTDEQETYLSNLRDEIYKRAATSGPYGDYTGGGEDE